ncbi:MAG: polynucleotide adenylyltransferase PcnB [Spirochaetales bacterium]|nr:polynucleotide adenylyltransferase PcnB [Spirochaetales bacterium]
MLVRYRQTENGKREKLANIYGVEDHGIQRSQIDRNALSVTRRLQRAGYGAYIVGGAVRDLLLGKRPKDFDVVTDAPPRKIRRLFRNSRIIGNRFQLVHVYYGNTIIEVSTFRTTTPETEDSIFGTMAEDVLRRDFTMNGLFYDPEREHIIDYVGGLDDIRAKRVRALVPVETSFLEDPVRMIRALRYAATTGFQLHGKISKHIRKRAALIQECPISRLTEELFKILGSGDCAVFFESAIEHGLLSYLLPNIEKTIVGKNKQHIREDFLGSLRELDKVVSDGPDVKKGVMLASLVAPFIEPERRDEEDPYALRRDIFLSIKELIAPLTPPNLEVDMAAGRILGIPASRRRSGRRRRQQLQQKRIE